MGGSVRCWHCGDDVARDKIFSLPRAYDPEEKKFFVYGACCSPECAKAYILEHSSFDRGQQLNTLARMLYTVHGISDEIKEKQQLGETAKSKVSLELSMRS